MDANEDSAPSNSSTSTSSKPTSSSGSTVGITCAASSSKSSNGAGSSSAPTPAKRKKSSLHELKLNANLLQPEVLDKLKAEWKSGSNFEKPDLVSLFSEPFTHVEIPNFIQNQDLLSRLLEIFSDGTIFQSKASDLFTFEQSDDLRSIDLKEVEVIRNFFEGEVLNFMSQLTGFPLNGTVDMFFSNYQRNDFLLCHDDELESRRIAFILYLSPEWKAEFGGSLDLYNSTPDIQPTTIAKSIIPSYNNFVFFDVTCKSFHQVSEVLESGAERFALSGWFYGDPIPRPKITFPPVITHTLHDNITEHSLKDAVTPIYTEAENYPLINQQLEENSEVLLVDFLQAEFLSEICAQAKTMEWEDKGPVNICSYLIPKITLWPEASVENSTIYDLSKLFHSKELFQFLEKITEFPFTADDNVTVVSSQLKKYRHRSYELLRSRGSETKSGSKSPSDDEDEAEEEPTQVDLIYYFGEFEWDEDFGGLTVYNDSEGEQLITVKPCPNSLAVVVRGSSVVSYVNYVNSLAGDNEFYTYTMTFAFNGII